MERNNPAAHGFIARRSCLGAAMEVVIRIQQNCALSLLRDRLLIGSREPGKTDPLSAGAPRWRCRSSPMNFVQTFRSAVLENLSPNRELPEDRPIPSPPGAHLRQQRHEMNSAPTSCAADPRWMPAKINEGDALGSFLEVGPG